MGDLNYAFLPKATTKGKGNKIKKKIGTDGENRCLPSGTQFKVIGKEGDFLSSISKQKHNR